MIVYELSREQIEEQFEFLCNALEEGCGCGELGNASRCIMLSEYVALCELRDMALRGVSFQESRPKEGT